jgi:predicted lipid-binding transport protein (Tim44 family)
MPEWLNRALMGILVPIGALFFWGCIAGVMGASSMLICIGAIGVVAAIVSWTRKQTIEAPRTATVGNVPR